MHPPTAKEAAKEYVKISGGEHDTARQIGLSFASLLPETDSWAIVKQDDQTYLAAVTTSGFWRASVESREQPRVRVELVPLQDCRLSVEDFGDEKDWNLYVMHREWTVEFVRGEPSSLTFKAAWKTGEGNRTPSRVEQFGTALCSALGWELSPIPPDFAAE